MGLFEILCGIAVVIFALYYYLTLNFDFWKLRGVRGPRPTFGNFKDIIFGKISIGDFSTKIYNAYKNEKMIGIFVGTTTVLIVKDLDLIKDVLIEDFSIFASRGLTTLEKVRILKKIYIIIYYHVGVEKGFLIKEDL